jgi:hypothetical protein
MTFVHNKRSSSMFQISHISEETKVEQIFGYFGSKMIKHAWDCSY